MQHKIEYVLFLLFRFIILRCSLKNAQRIGASFGIAAYHLLPGRRKVAIDNLTHAFPEKSIQEIQSITKASFRNYGISLIELLWFPKLNDDVLHQLVRLENPERLIEGNAQGKGMVMLAGHFGNWELIAFAVARMCRLPFTIIVQTQSNSLIDRVINRHRCLLGNKVVPMGMSVREILRTIQEGGIIAIAPDQSGPMEGVFVDFFGRSVATHQGPAVFALSSGAIMQYGFIIRQADGTYNVVIEEVPASDLHGRTDENVLELTRRHTALLERYIRKYPGHWLWMHRRWKHTWESVQQSRQSLDGTYARS